MVQSKKRTQYAYAFTRLYLPQQNIISYISVCIECTSLVGTRLPIG
jgi:hypothetical protein